MAPWKVDFGPMEVGKIIGIMSFFGSTTIIMLYVNASDLLKNKKILKKQRINCGILSPPKATNNRKHTTTPRYRKAHANVFSFSQNEFPLLLLLRFRLSSPPSAASFRLVYRSIKKKNFWCDCCRKSVTKASHEAKRKNKNFLMLQSGCALRERKQLTVFNVQFITSW